MGGGGEWSQQNQRSVPGKRGSPAQLTRGTHTTQPEAAVGWGPRGTQKRGHPGKGWEEESDLLALWPTVSVSINNLYPGCENVSVRSRSMMFEPGLTKGMLEVFGAPAHHPHCSADDQSTKAIDIQNAYLNGMARPSKWEEPRISLWPQFPPGSGGGRHPSQLYRDKGRASAA